MSAATEAAKKFKGMKIVKHGEWETELKKAVSENKTDAKGWKKILSDMSKELGKEQTDTRANMDEYNKVFAAFHDDIKDRLQKTEAMMKAIPGSKDAKRLQAQAAEYIKVVIRELADALGNMKTESKAWMGNRENIAVPGLDKATDPVPVKELQNFLKNYGAERKKLIDYSNAITNAHLHKMKTFEPRAMDLLKAIQTLANIDSFDREEIKDEVRVVVEEVEGFFKKKENGNFIGANDVLKAMSALLKKVEKLKPEDQKKEILAVGGGSRIRTFEAQVAKEHNAWKIIEKKVIQLRAISNKLKNKTLDKRIKPLEKLSAQNKVIGDGFKADLKALLDIWKKVESLEVAD